MNIQQFETNNYVKLMIKKISYQLENLQVMENNMRIVYQ